MAVVRLLGPVDVVSDDGTIRAPRTALRCTLLALLALDAGRVVEGERLLDAAWNGEPPASRLRALRFHISKLRAELGIDDLIVTVGSGYRLDADVDVESVRRVMRDGGDDAGGVEELLGSWRGAPLGGVSRCAALEHEAERLQDLEVELQDRLFACRVEEGTAAQVLAELARRCREQPLRESLWQSLIAAHYQAGNQADALAAVAELRENLVEHLGIDPSPEVQELERRVLQQDPDLTPVAEPAPTIRSTGTLPPVRDDIVGRRDERKAIADLVRQRPLVSVIGAGGVGKTRVAREVAGRLTDEFPDGVWWADLAPVVDSGGVAPTVAQTLGVRQHRERSLVDSLGAACRHRRLLLVLDNCEHVLDSAVEVVDAIQAAAPDVRVLATSREALGCQGEQTYPLPSLPIDGPESDATVLFHRRVTDLDPTRTWNDEDEQAIIAICQQVDGIPLAIELAAGRTRTMTPVEIADHLDDQFHLLRGGRQRVERHRTLRAAIDWSHETLDPAEQLVFSRLAVFAGSFDLDAAEVVCADDDLDPDDVCDLLDALVARSMLTAEVDPLDHRTRYRMLEPIRQYAEEVADPTDLLPVRDRHARYFVDWAEEWDRFFREITIGSRERLDRDFGNLRAAFRWLLDAGEADDAGGLIAALQSCRTSFLRFEIGTWAEELVDQTDVIDRPTGFIVAAVAALNSWGRNWDSFSHYAALVDQSAHLDPTVSHAAVVLAAAAYISGDPVRAVDVHLAGADRTDPYEHSIAVWLSQSYAPDRDWTEARADLDAHVHENGSPLAQTIAAVVRANAAWFADDGARMLPTARAAVELADSWGGAFWREMVLPSFGHGIAANDAVTREDLELLRDSTIELRDSGQYFESWLGLAGTAHVLVNLGRNDLARAIGSGMRRSPFTIERRPPLYERLGADPADDEDEEPPDLDDLVPDVLAALDALIADA